jgi:hypothetical protein
MCRILTKIYIYIYIHVTTMMVKGRTSETICLVEAIKSLWEDDRSKCEVERWEDGWLLRPG